MRKINFWFVPVLVSMGVICACGAKAPAVTSESGTEGETSEKTGEVFSPYYETPDFQNLGNTSSRVMLTGFPSRQQPSEEENAGTCVDMILDWYGYEGKRQENHIPSEASLKDIHTFFTGLEGDWEVYSSFEADIQWSEEGLPMAVLSDGSQESLFELFPRLLKEGKPVMIHWDDWGGQYELIVGYDNMGTELGSDDVFIIADPRDTSDHNQDGFGVVSVQRLIHDFASSDPDFEYGVFLAASPKEFVYEAKKGSEQEKDEDNKGNFDDSHVIVEERLAESIKTMAEQKFYNSDYPIWLDGEGISGPRSGEYYRKSDHDNSLYYKLADVPAMKSNDNLTILEGYKSIQQATEYTCGSASMLSVLEWFGKRRDLNEIDLAMTRGELSQGATTKELLNEANALEGEWNILSAYDLDEKGCLQAGQDLVKRDDIFRYFLEKDVPVMVLSHSWGGHWQVVIGYDTMGTEEVADDVLILMDPYDTTDHNQDGFVIQSYERFIKDWTNRFWAEELREGAFVVVYPK